MRGGALAEVVLRRARGTLVRGASAVVLVAPLRIGAVLLVGSLLVGSPLVSQLLVSPLLVSPLLVSAVLVSAVLVGSGLVAPLRIGAVLLVGAVLAPLRIGTVLVALPCALLGPCALLVVPARALDARRRVRARGRGHRVGVLAGRGVRDRGLVLDDPVRLGAMVGGPVVRRPVVGPVPAVLVVLAAVALPGAVVVAGFRPTDRGRRRLPVGHRTTGLVRGLAGRRGTVATVMVEQGGGGAGSAERILGHWGGSFDIGGPPRCARHDSAAIGEEVGGPPLDISGICARPSGRRRAPGRGPGPGPSVRGDATDDRPAR